MKNIFSKTLAEKRTQNGVKSYLCPTFVLSPILIFAFLTLGIGQMWADKTVWEWKLYYWNGSSNQWLGGDNNTGDLDFGVVNSNFWWKGAWAKTSDKNSNSVTVYYVEPDGTEANFGLTYQNCWDDCYNKFWKNESGCNIQLASSSVYKNNPGVNTIQFYVQIDGSNKLTPKATYTLPGFTTTSTSQTFDNTTVSSNSSKTISFGNHYGTALTTSNCALSGTNSSEFEVTSISETNVTVKFKPSSAGNKSATLTITDAHSKTCTISLSGKTQYAVSYQKGSTSGATGSTITDHKVYGTNLTIRSIGGFSRTGYSHTAWNTNSTGTGGTSYAFGATYSTEAALTLYPTWVEKRYSVTIAANNTSLGTLKIDDTSKSWGSGYTIGVTNKITVTPNTGYCFSGWSSMPSGMHKVTDNTTTRGGDAYFYADGTGKTITANFAPSYAFLEGRMTVYNSARTIKTHIGNSEGGWNESSTNIRMTFDETNHRFYYHTYRTPAELTAKQNSNTDYQWFSVTISTANNNLTSPVTFHPSSNGLLASTGIANKILAQNSTTTYNYRLNSNVTTGYVILYFDEAGVWYELEHTLAYNGNGSTGGSAPAAKTYYNNGATHTVLANTYTRTGYNFSKWNTAPNGSGTDKVAGNTISMTANTTLYAQWTAKQSALTFDYQSSTEGWGSNGSIGAVSATYDATMPALSGSLPTAANGYAFMGFYDAVGGGGTRYYDGSGNSVHTWDKNTESGTTLYAYYKKAEVTEISFATTTVEPSSTVTATPTVSPTPTGSTILCWRVLYNNDNPLDPQPEITPAAENVYNPALTNAISFTAPSTPGTYKVEATLRKGSSCGEGDELSVQTNIFQVAGDHTVTIRYKCGDETIKESTTITGKPLEWTSISAPDIFGYTFSTWQAGDGITLQSSATTNSNKLKATYDGTLTAVYTKKKLIFIDLSQTFGTGKWNNPYVYFYKATYWDSSKGTGERGENCIAYGVMKQIGSTGIWYYDYTNVPATFNGSTVAFTWGSGVGHDNFNGVEAIYRTDFSEGTPLFVPAVGQNAETKSWSGGSNKYFSKGYWVNYIGENTGYSIIIYNSSGTELKRKRFTAEDKRMSMKATLDLEASTTYKIDILRDNGHYYRNTANMTYSSHTNWEYKETGDKQGIVTTAAGDYTFTLGYGDSNNNKDYQIRLTANYPIKNGDYRLVYTDDTRSGRLKPSAIVPMVNNGKDTVSFFVRKDKHPQVRIQKATVTSGGAITWAEYPTPGTLTNQITGAIATAIRTDSVYNFNLSMNGSGALSVTSAERYLGDFYIRTDAANNKWDNYVNADHAMTYSEYAEEHSDFTHYWMAHVYSGTNVKCVVANDYSPCISDTLITGTYKGTNDNIHVYASDGGGHIAGEIKVEANIRFMWDYRNNTLLRSYLAAAQSDGSKFLVLEGQSTHNIKAEDGSNLTSSNNHGAPNDCMQFVDDQNWIYETTVQVLPSSYVKLYAYFNSNTFYYKGSAGAFDAGHAIILITGSGSHLRVRVIYDFKTDRLVAAFLPSGDISGQVPINADVMFIREHQGDIDQVTFSKSGGTMGAITDIKTAYGVIRFNKWTINNKSKETGHAPLAVPLSRYERDLFYISFPFRVNLNEVFGFGTYGTHWIIQEYDGAGRAEKGFWKDSPTFWKYIFNRQGKYLEPNTGYILALDLDELTESSEVWNNGVENVELFFPSSGTLTTITNANVTHTLPEHTCTIVRAGSDRRIADSHWNIMSVPTYVNTKNPEYANATWTSTKPNFLYTWNSDDNTLTPTSASGFTYHAMHAYTVQYYGDVTWKSTSVSPAAMPVRNSEYRGEYELCVELQQNEKMIDRTYVRMSDEEEVTTGFEFGYDMSKDLNRNKANIYSYIGSEMVAGNTLPLETEQTTIVPLGVFIPTAGDYTFAIPDGTNGVGITLIDEETGIRTSLSALDYTVELAAGDYTERFWLEISPVKGTETGIDPGVDARENGVRKVMIDGLLYIVRDGKMFDATGKRVE
ncbi:MAG: InlB B-repeat-containing protein [Paludibacteraceae bacterium]|nr:InlB B-repeat-containing protein [Paludibacteraceae bacterium]